jgi:hypothetical protein|tara:strand:+ start:1054 stop:1584 length:531 start_codon:yes stop_codon:yes gene_type:complete
MYFDKFPLTVYDMKGNGAYKLLPNIIKRVKLKAGIAASRFIFDNYDVSNNEKPEDIAFKYYGDAEYHWVILLTNNITDRFYQWPLTQPQFDAFLTDKYGSGNEDAIHHYELAQTSGATTSRDDTHMLEVNSDTVDATSISNRQYEDRQQDKFRQIRLLDKRYLDQFVEEFFTLMKI